MLLTKQASTLPSGIPCGGAGGHEGGAPAEGGCCNVSNGPSTFNEDCHVSFSNLADADAPDKHCNNCCHQEEDNGRKGRGESSNHDEVAVDYNCTIRVDGVMVMCNANFGKTGCVSINKNLLLNDFIVSSIAKMNKYYLWNANF
jgi:hypothetical protein